MDGWMDVGCTEQVLDTRKYAWMDKWTDLWIEGRMDGWMDSWMT